MGENNDLFLNKMLLKYIDEEIPIDINLINTPAKNLPSKQERRRCRTRKAILKMIKNMSKQQKIDIKRRFC